MKILSLSIDKSILDQNSRSAQRVAEYKGLVEKYIVLVPHGKFKIFALFNLYNQARKVIKKEGIDIITVQDTYFVCFIAHILSKRFRIGLEIQIHGWEKFYGLRKLIAEHIIPKANSVRVVSQRLKKQLIKKFGVKEEKITVIPIYAYVEIQDAEFMQNESRIINQNRFVFLTIGRLVPVKNIKLQICALAEIVKRYPNTELWIVGDGKEKKNLQHTTNDLQLGSKVKFLGWQNNLDQFYSQANVFMLTSFAEGWPLVIMESCYYGLPIIMTDVGSVGELIVNNESGIVIPIGDKNKLIESMIKLIEDKNLREQLGWGAQEAVKRLPTREETLKLYKQSWEKALLEND